MSQEVIFTLEIPDILFVWLHPGFVAVLFPSAAEASVDPLLGQHLLYLLLNIMQDSRPFRGEGR
jgi:hypothetical protein